MSFESEYQAQVARMGPALADDTLEPISVAITVLQGDGKRDEAAAVAWWCGLDEAEAQDVVTVAQRGERPE